MSQNKERHFCFVYFGNRMHVPDFPTLHFNLVEGCCCHDDSGRLVQFIRISLHQKNGRRMATIPRIIDEYNKMVGRTELIDPIVYYPSFNASAVMCFKSSAPVRGNPILARIASAKQQSIEDEYWTWSSSAQAPAPSKVVRRQESTGRRFITSLHDVVREMQLPESVVPVQRVYSELSEPYFRQYGMPLGEGTGCIPEEHRGFVVSEIKRLFEEELSYTEQPSVQVLPPQAMALLQDDDILNSSTPIIVSAVTTCSSQRTITRKRYTKTPQRASPLMEFLVFYSLQWNDACLDTVCYPIETLFRGWLEASVDFSVFSSVIASSDICEIQGGSLRIASINDLLKMLSEDGLIVETAQPYSVKMKQLRVALDCAPVAPIVAYFKEMLSKGWEGFSVEVSASDVVKVLNAGDVGVYRQTCVRQFMKPFIHDMSVTAWVWMEGAIQREKYVIDVQKVAARIRL